MISALCIGCAGSPSEDEQAEEAVTVIAKGLVRWWFFCPLSLDDTVIIITDGKIEFQVPEEEAEDLEHVEISFKVDGHSYSYLIP